MVRDLSPQLVVLVVVMTLFGLTGCATTMSRRGAPGLIDMAVALPFAVLGGVVEVVTGYDTIHVTEASRKIAEYCGSRYSGRDYATCRNGAYGYLSSSTRHGYRSHTFENYRRHSTGLAASRLEHDRRVWEDGENFGRSLENSGH